MNRLGFIFTLGLSLLLGSHPARGQTVEMISPAQVRQQLAGRLSAEELDQLKIPFAANEEIRELSAKLTAHAHSDDQKLRALLHYFRKQNFAQQYHQGHNRTAREVLAQGRGNCVAYTSLFIAMARAAGLRAFYLDASQVQNEFGRSGSILVDYGHIMAGVRIGARVLPVDFDGQARKINRYQAIDDLQAIADFYNNLGFERTWAGQSYGQVDKQAVVEAFDLATRIWPDFARAWNNLGVALVRNGQPERAMLAYRRAQAIDPAMPAPHANLGHVLARLRQADASLAAYHRAVELDATNAHYRFFLGRALAQQGQYPQALAQLEKGARLNPELPNIQMEMARIHQGLGEDGQARRLAERVLQMVPGHHFANVLIQNLDRKGG